jgi:hypothetical protein
MATLFPFNIISSAPTKILKQFLTPVNKQINQVDSLVTDLNSYVSSLSKNASCDDIEIITLKNKLKILLASVESLQQIANVFPQISTALRTLNTAALVVGAAQLAIPSAPGVPQGPIGQSIAAAADAVSSIKACILILQNLIEDINDLLQEVAEAVTDAEDAIANTCKTNDNTAGAGLTINPVTLDTLEEQYFSEFYRSVNVSDEDLQQRLNTIQDLVDEQLSIRLNLNEAPSRVLTGLGAPAPTLGQPGDYYIDERTQTVFGPKISIDTWN